MEIVATPAWAITGVVRVVVHTACQRTKVGMKAATSGETVTFVEAQMPFTHHVRGVAGLLEALWQGDHVKRQTVGLAGPDDRMLETRVDLIPEEREDETFYTPASEEVQLW